MKVSVALVKRKQLGDIRVLSADLVIIVDGEGEGASVRPYRYGWAAEGARGAVSAEVRGELRVGCAWGAGDEREAPVAGGLAVRWAYPVRGKVQAPGTRKVGDQWVVEAEGCGVLLIEVGERVASVLHWDALRSERSPAPVVVTPPALQPDDLNPPTSPAVELGQDAVDVGGLGVESPVVVTVDDLLTSPEREEPASGA